MKKTLAILSMLLLTVLSTAFWQSCKKKDDGGSSSSDAVLMIQTGARSVEPGTPITYSAVVVDAKGNTTPASNVTWSAGTAIGTTSSLGSFAGGVFTPAVEGSGTITASATFNGKTLTAKVPVGIYLPAVFAVAPSAIIWTTDAGTIPLMPVYLGTGSVSGYTYTSSDATIASVSASGEVSFLKAGECIITVTANGLSGNNKVYIPVLVVGMPTVSLPVVRVAVNPAAAQLFRGEIANFTAKAYNNSNGEVSSTFTWASQDANVATVDATGKVTAVALGKTLITATTNGISGQAEVEVLPDTTIIVTPFMGSISAGGSKQFTAKAYAVIHSTKSLTEITMPAGLTWEIPTTGIPIFDIASVNSTGVVTMNSSATVGLSTVVIAHVSSPTIDPGAAMIMVSDCNCGTTTPGVDHIKISGSTTLNVSLTAGPFTIAAAAVDASNNPVSGATINLCSDNITACSVDITTPLTLVPSGLGTAIITVCNGDVSTTITVNVGL